MITDWLLGVRPTYDGLLIDPCLPLDWEGASLRREWRGASYEINISKPRGLVGGQVDVSIDGVPQPGNVVPAFSDGKSHLVEVKLSRQ